MSARTPWLRRLVTIPGLLAVLLLLACSSGPAGSGQGAGRPAAAPAAQASGAAPPATAAAQPAAPLRCPPPSMLYPAREWVSVVFRR